MKKKANKSAAPAAKPGKARIITGIILAVLLLALLGGALWFILDRTNGGTEDFRVFAVTMDGEEVKSTKAKKSLLRGEHTVSVDYLFDFITGEEYDYNVDIVPVDGIRFNYIVDGKQYPWRDQTALAKAFQVKKEATGFTFTVPDNLAAVLAAIYPNANVIAPRENELNDAYIYALVVSSYNEKTTYTITFSIAVDIDGVQTDKPEVQFP